jgi:hypothetical protein
MATDVIYSSGDDHIVFDRLEELGLKNLRRVVYYEDEFEEEEIVDKEIIDDYRLIELKVCFKH